MEIILIIVLATLTKGEIKCASKNEDTILKIVADPIEIESVWEKEIEIKTHGLKRNGLSQYIRITRSRAHCSEVPFSEYGECDERTEAISLTEKEALDSISTNRCRVGSECLPEGECWGEMASKCLGSNREHFKQPSAEILKAKSWFKILFHTCSQRWNCEIGSFTPLIQLTTRHTYTLTDPFGYVILFNFGEKSKRNPLNYTIVPNLWDGTYIVRQKAKCIIQRQRSICLTQNTSEIIDFDSKGISLDGEKFHEIMDHDIHLENHLKISYSSPNLSSFATISDLVNLQHSLLYDNLQSHLNARVLAISLTKSYQLLTRTISSLSMTHPKLLTDVFNIPGYTYYSEGNAFIQRACIESGPSPCLREIIRGTESRPSDCKLEKSLKQIYVNFTWMGDLNLEEIPELQFYSSPAYNNLIEQLRISKAESHILSDDEQEDNAKDWELIKSHLFSWTSTLHFYLTWINFIGLALLTFLFISWK